MESPGPTNEILSEHRPKALPGMLNVLTILTFIGCGIAYLRTCYSYIASNDYEKQIEKFHSAIQANIFDKMPIKKIYVDT